MLLNAVAFCCSKFETGQTFQPTTPNISFVPWSPRRSAIMLDPFAQLFQHCWDHARSLRMVYKDLWVVSFLRCTTGPNIVGICLHPFAHHCQHTRNNSQNCWRNNVGVVASICTQPKNPESSSLGCVQTDATTPNTVAPSMLGVVACVLAVVCKRIQQLPKMLGPAVHRGKDTTHKSL